MDLIWKILAEFGVLALVAFGYYWYQKKKIIRNDKIEIYHTLKEMTEDMYKYMDKNSKLSDHTEIKKYTDLLHTNNESQNYEELVILFNSPPPHLPAEFGDALPSISEQVNFHIIKK